jgi:hypothetical protein
MAQMLEYGSDATCSSAAPTGLVDIDGEREQALCMAFASATISSGMYAGMLDEC